MKIFSGYQNGINLGGWLSQFDSFDEHHFNTFITEQDIEEIAGLGFDHVRLPIDIDVLEDEKGNHIETGYTHIQNCVDWCIRSRLNIVLDLHKAFGYMFDMDAVPNPDLFFTDVTYQDRFVETWRTLISRFGKYSNMMAFELLNEVVNPAYAKTWNEIADRTISMIREYTTDAYLILGGVRNNNVTSIPQLDAPHDDHIVFNFHCYEPLCFTHQHAHWVKNIDFDMSYPDTVAEYIEKSANFDSDLIEKAYGDKTSEQIGPQLFEELFEVAIEHASKYDVPLYCGEYGVIDKAPIDDTIRWYQDINTVFSKYSIGHALWTYKEKDFGITGSHYGEKFKAFVCNTNKLIIH